jgi:hypothetical protein
MYFEVEVPTIPIPGSDSLPRSLHCAPFDSRREFVKDGDAQLSTRVYPGPSSAESECAVSVVAWHPPASRVVDRTFYYVRVHPSPMTSYCMCFHLTNVLCDEHDAWVGRLWLS